MADWEWAVRDFLKIRFVKKKKQLDSESYV